MFTILLVVLLALLLLVVPSVRTPTGALLLLGIAILLIVALDGR